MKHASLSQLVRLINAATFWEGFCVILCVLAVFSSHFHSKMARFFCFFFSASKAAILPNEIISHRELPPLHSRSTSKKEFKLSTEVRSKFVLQKKKKKNKQTLATVCVSYPKVSVTVGTALQFPWPPFPCPTPNEMSIIIADAHAHAFAFAFSVPFSELQSTIIVRKRIKRLIQQQKNTHTPQHPFFTL